MSKKIKTIEITDEVLSKIHTDSDVYEMAEEIGVSAKDLEYAICNKKAEGTSCHNCEYVSLNHMTYPCNGCKRIHTEDFYKKMEFNE